MSKISFIKDYVDQCIEILENEDSKQAKNINGIIVETFLNEIDNIHYGLDNYNGLALYDNSLPDYLGDTKKLKVKMQNYMYDLKRQDEIYRMELEKLRLQSSNVSNIFNNKNSNENTTNISLSVSINTHINNTLQLIDDDKKLSSNEKQELQILLMDLQSDIVKKDEDSAKGKLKSVIATLMDKGTDTLINLLPNIGSISTYLSSL